MKNHDWEEPNLIEGLRQAGHDVVEHYDWQGETSKRKIFFNITFLSLCVSVKVEERNTSSFLGNPFEKLSFRPPVNLPRRMSFS